MKTRAWVLGIILLITATVAVAEFWVGPGGLYIESGAAPSPSSYKLYNVGGALYWNGVAVGSGSGTFACTGTDQKWTVATANTQAAIVTALSTAAGGPVYLPAGTYNIATSGIALSYQGQILSGAGVGRTILYAQSGFADDGVLEISAGHVCVKDLTIRFYQPPDFSARSQLNGYGGGTDDLGSAAIYASVADNLQFQNLELDMVYNGIRLMNNCGGSDLNGIRMTHFSRGIEVETSLSTMRFANIHFDAADLAETELALFKDDSTYGMYVGRSDPIGLNGCKFDCGTGAYMYFETGVGSPMITASNCLFNNANGIICNGENGRLKLSNCRFVLDAYAKKGVSQTKGSEIVMNGCSFYNTKSGAIAVDLSASDSEVSMSGCYFYGSVNQDEIYLYPSGSSSYVMSNCLFERGSSLATGFVVQSGANAKLTMVGCRCTPASYGKALTLVNTNIGHVVCGNCFNGWTHDATSGIDEEGDNN